MENIIELDYFIKPGNIGFFSYCEVTQIILYIKIIQRILELFLLISIVVASILRELSAHG